MRVNKVLKVVKSEDCSLRVSVNEGMKRREKWRGSKGDNSER